MGVGSFWDFSDADMKRPPTKEVADCVSKLRAKCEDPRRTPLQVYIEANTKGRTQKEVREFMTSRAYLETFCAFHKYDPKKCLAEMQKLAVAKSATAEDWESMLRGARGEPGIENEEMAIALAEREFVNTGYAPPHWVKIVECENCGPMPVKEKGCCPWCATHVGHVLGLAKEGNEKHRHSGVAKKGRGIACENIKTERSDSKPAVQFVCPIVGGTGAQFEAEPDNLEDKNRRA